MQAKLTEEHKLQLLEDFNNGISVKAIGVKYGVSHSSASRIAIAMGASPRRARVSKEHTKTCPKCRKHIDVKGAKFCCFCGADIRSSKEILIERISSSMTKLKYLPGDARD